MMTGERSMSLAKGSRRRGALPTYIIIGAMKCGTTSLHHYLSKHPQISTSGQKELDFFLIAPAFGKGVDWYASQFDDTRPVRGESSPNYSKAHLFSGVPERMYSVVPDCKLIYVVRNPIDRAISHYLHGWVAERESRPVSEAFQDLDGNNYALTGRYALQLERFLEYYREDQVMVVVAEDLLHDRLASLSRVFRFLGVDEKFDCADFHTVHHATAGRPGILSRLLNRHGSSLVRSVRQLLPDSAINKIRSMASTPVPRVTLDPELRARLLDYYRPDVLALSRFLDGRVPTWS